MERCVALLARLADHDLIARGSFFQRDFISKQRAAGLPLHLITHEDVLVFRTTLTPTRTIPTTHPRPMAHLASVPTTPTPSPSQLYAGDAAGSTRGAA